ncbi:MAG: group II intron maturase-specific domain-containing protein [Anaerolineae bacterium]
MHEFDDWYIRTYRVRPEWSHLAPSSLQYRRKKEIGGTLMLTRYADDWVAVWNGSRERAEEIKAEIKAFLADELKLRLSEEKTLITHIDDGFDFLGYRMVGGKRWSDGQWCLFSWVPQKAIRRFRDAVKEIAQNTFTDEVAAFAALSGLIRGWGNYYAYAAESRLMDSLDAFIYQQLWQYCRRKNQRVGAKEVRFVPTLRSGGGSGDRPAHRNLCGLAAGPTHAGPPAGPTLPPTAGPDPPRSHRRLSLPHAASTPRHHGCGPRSARPHNGCELSRACVACRGSIPHVWSSTSVRSLDIGRRLQ